MKEKVKITLVLLTLFLLMFFLGRATVDYGKKNLGNVISIPADSITIELKEKDYIKMKLGFWKYDYTTHTGSTENGIKTIIITVKGEENRKKMIEELEGKTYIKSVEDSRLNKRFK